MLLEKLNTFDLHLGELNQPVVMEIHEFESGVLSKLTEILEFSDYQNSNPRNKNVFFFEIE